MTGAGPCVFCEIADVMDVPFMVVDVLFWVSSVVCVISLAHAPIFTAAMRWHGKNVGLVYSDHDLYKSRQASPPWYVRYTSWLLRRRMDALDPVEPERIRLVDADGAETAPASVTYLGLDQRGMHVYQAHFPLDTFPWGVPSAQFPRLTVGKLPARTVLRCRFEEE